jgi:hypothetical protein
MASLRNLIKKIWDIIKGGLMITFQELHSGDLPLFSLNFGVISLILKAQDVNHIQQYISICLLNVSYKIFTKVTTNRINQVADCIISPSQTAFMRGETSLWGLSFFMNQYTRSIKKNRMKLSLKLILRRHMIRSNDLSFFRV